MDTFLIIFADSRCLLENLNHQTFTCNVINFFRYAPVGVFPGYPHPNSHHPYMPWTPHPAEHPIPAVFVHPGHPDYPHPHAQVDGHPSQGHSSHQGRAESVSSSDSGSSKKGSKVRKNNLGPRPELIPLK